MNTKIIVFSGLDGCGKSTQIERLRVHFKKEGQKYRVIWARPGSTPILMKIKDIARFFIRSLPAVGRSDKRDHLLKKSVLGKVWLIIGFIELLYIFKIKSFLFTKLGYIIIFDRHLIDALIDYKVLLGDRFTCARFVNAICMKKDRRAIKIYLAIPFEESLRRCSIKWEPFPDSFDEKKKRESYYIKLMNNIGYSVMNGMEESEHLHKEVLKLIEEKDLI